MTKVFVLASFCLATGTLGFVVSPDAWSLIAGTSTTRLTAKKSSASRGSDRGGGKGFGAGSITDKTYETNIIRDLIDSEGAMQEFFTANDEWSPLFRSMATSSNAPAMSFLGGSHGDEIEFTESTAPWKRLQGIPTDDCDRSVLAAFLDSVQQSLIDIPVNEETQEDELDLHFLEEELSRTDEADTGSLILVPDYDIDDLRRFTDMNLIRPLQWLGMDDVFEVASMQRDSPAIRLIHKLSNMPTEPYDE